MGYFYLLLSVLSGTAGAISLKLSEGFTKPLPIIGNIVGFLLAVWLLSIAMLTIDLSVAYASWVGIGILLTVLSGMFFFKEKPTSNDLTGIILVFVGMFLMNFF